MCVRLTQAAFATSCGVVSVCCTPALTLLPSALRPPLPPPSPFPYTHNLPPPFKKQPQHGGSVRAARLSGREGLQAALQALALSCPALVRLEVRCQHSYRGRHAECADLGRCLLVSRVRRRVGNGVRGSVFRSQTKLGEGQGGEGGGLGVV